MKVKQLSLEQDFENREIIVFVNCGDGRWMSACSLSYDDCDSCPNLGNDDDYRHWLGLADDVLYSMGYEVDE